ncbi:MAG: hypothetical protein WA825_07120 [Steroidobacteraceae bacterium]
MLSFISGAVCTLAGLVLLLPWLRTIPGLGTLPALPWPAGAAALIAIVIVAGLNLGGTPAPQSHAAATVNAPATGNSWADVADAMGRGVAGLPASGAKDTGRAGSMDTAIAALQARLAKSGGSDDDWELLAKSYDFLGRPQEAAQARAHQLPATKLAPAAPTDSSAPVSTEVTGEVMLAPNLAARAAAGTTLFIIAKSVNSPGAPVAVYRGSVGAWPLKFSLDDSQSMLPGRSLSNAGRVTIEARISHSGQPLATAGDLQGTSAIINPQVRQPVKILIDTVIR